MSLEGKSLAIKDLQKLLFKKSNQTSLYLEHYISQNLVLKSLNVILLEKFTTDALICCSAQTAVCKSIAKFSLAYDGAILHRY